MNIRSLTVSAALPEDEAARASTIDVLGSFAQAGRSAIEAAGFTVQTTRLSTQPVERWLAPNGDAAEIVARLGQQCTDSGIGYCSLGTMQAASDLEGKLAPLMEMLPDLLLSAENVYASIQVGSREEASGTGTVNLEAVRSAARTM